MKKKIHCCLFSLFIAASFQDITAQNIAINPTGAQPDTSAMLDVSSTVKGFLLPRMTTAQRNAIPLPAKGLIVYNTSTNELNINTGTAAAASWSTLSLSTAVTSDGWGLSGNSGTSSSNFIGTTDGQPLTFKVNGTTAGYLGLSGSSFATSFGVSSGAAFQGTAIGANANASNNNLATALGYNATAAGYQSVAVGANSKTGSNNDAIAIGVSSYANSYRGIAIGSSAQTGSNNDAIAIGVGANATGYQSTAIGNGATATGQNSTAIGNGASVSNANYISIGNTSVTAIRGQVNFTTYSDGRFKTNIRENVPGLDFIMKLRPVTYNWDIHKFNAHNRGEDYQLYPASYKNGDEAAILAKEKITYTGFIAQEVEHAAKASQFDFSGVLKPANEKDAYSLSYAEFVVPLVKATQELTLTLEKQQKTISLLQKKIARLERKHSKK